jgi:Flp pilus assembly protein TadG
MNTQKVRSFTYPMRSPKKRFSRGQSAVEFALISVLALAVMVIGIQYAIIGQAAVAVSQGSSALARYASSNAGNYLTNGTIKASALPLAAQQVLPQTLLSNSGGDLTVTVSSLKGDGATTEANPPTTGEEVVITLSYDTTSKLAVPNPFLAMPPIFPGITFPATVAAKDSQMYEY